MYEIGREINVVYITDDKYYPNTLVSAYSLYRNRSMKREYNIYIISVDIEQEEMKLTQQLEADNFHIIWMPQEEKMNDYLITDFHVSPVACYKFSLAQILKDVDKVLYLDGDTIVNSNLEELYDIKLNDKLLAAVRDLSSEQFVPSQPSKLGIDTALYFNSGVMLINLRGWREQDVRQKLINYRKTGINYFMDQDALNVVLYKYTKYIKCKYNYMISYNQIQNKLKGLHDYGYDTKMLEPERLKQAHVIHLAGKVKPWNVYIEYVTSIFMNYYLDSPFRYKFYFTPKIIMNAESSLCETYLFPFTEVKRGCRIAIWGMGSVGIEFYIQIIKTDYCKIVGLIDKEKKQIEVGHNHLIPFELLFYPHEFDWKSIDYLVIAVKREDIAKSIINDAEQCGCDSGKIIWKTMYYRKNDF